MKTYRTLIFNALLIFILYGCTTVNPTPNPTPNPNSTSYTVKYKAIGNDDFYLFNIYNATGGMDSYQLPANQEWTYEFNATSGKQVGMGLSGSEQLPNALFSLKIYVNGVLWKEANGGPDIFVYGIIQ